VLKYLPRIHEPLSQEECCYKLRKVAHTHHHCLVFFLLQKEVVYGRLQDMEDFKSLRYKVFCFNCECLHLCNFTFYFKRTITQTQKMESPTWLPSSCQNVSTKIEINITSVPVEVEETMHLFYSVEVAVADWLTEYFSLLCSRLLRK